MSFKLLGINGSLTPPPSKTRSVLDAALAGARAYDSGVETEVLELRDYALEFCDGRSPAQYNSDTRRALALVQEADAYFVATPIYRGSYTGALKNFFDLVPNDPKGQDPLRGKVVGLLATGGSDHHYLILEHQLRPLFGFFGAYTPARAIYAVPKDFNAQKQPQGKLVEELAQLGQEVLILARFLADGFNLMPPYLPGGLDDFVDLVLPILRQRGLFRTEYEGRTLRENLGLARPVNQFSAAELSSVHAG